MLSGHVPHAKDGYSMTSKQHLLANGKIIVAFTMHHNIYTANIKQHKESCMCIAFTVQEIQ